MSKPSSHSKVELLPSDAYLLLNDAERSVVLGEEQDVSGFSFLLDRLRDEGLWRQEMPFVDGRIDGRQEDVGRFEVAEVAAEVPLHGVSDVHLVRLELPILNLGVDHLDEAVEVPETKVLSFLLRVDGVVAFGEQVDGPLHQPERVFVSGADSFGALFQVLHFRNSSGQKNPSVHLGRVEGPV